MTHKTFENPDGTFLNETGGTNFRTITSLTGDNVVMKWGERALYVKAAGTLSALTVTLPLVVNDGEFVTLAFQHAITTLTVNDGFGNLVAAAPTAAAAGAYITLRQINKTEGMVLDEIGATSLGFTPVNKAGDTMTGELGLTQHNTLTAHAGGGRASAVAIDKQFVRFSTVATAADSGVLPAGVAGDFRLVVNDGAAALQVFANGSDTIDGTAGATGVSVAAGTRAIFACLATGVWSAVYSGVNYTAANLAGDTFTGEVKLTAHDALTAHAGGGRSSAVALDKQFNHITVCATAADSVVLPAAVVGDFRTVVNDGAAAAQVFANGSDTIDSVAGATGVVLTNNKRAVYICVAAATWVSLMGVPSA